jgi:hypothetical protein
MQDLHNLVCAWCLNAFCSVLSFLSCPLPVLLLGSLTFASFFHRASSYPPNAYILSKKKTCHDIFIQLFIQSKRNSLGRPLGWFFATIIVSFAWCPRSNWGSVESQKFSSKSPTSLFSEIKKRSSAKIEFKRMEAQDQKGCVFNNSPKSKDLCLFEVSAVYISMSTVLSA